MALTDDDVAHDFHDPAHNKVPCTQNPRNCGAKLDGMGVEMCLRSVRERMWSVMGSVIMWLSAVVGSVRDRG